MAVVEINWTPTHRQLRQFGAAGLLALTGLGALVLWRHSFFGMHLNVSTTQGLALGLWAAAALCGLLAAVAPAALRPLYVALLVITWPIGFVVSHVIMAVLFYGLFTPIALIFRLMRRDAMQRRFDPSATTYWTPRQPVTDLKQYFRQS
jgi:hypothetical protein